jgi:hypothetical protein
LLFWYQWRHDAWASSGPSGEGRHLPFLKGLALEGYVVEASRSKKGGISGVDVSVRCDVKHCHRGLKEVLELIEKSDITPQYPIRLKPLSGCLRRLKARSMECP